MTDLPTRPLSDAELEAGLRALDPAPQVDYAALGRARQALVVSMATGHTVRSPRRRSQLRRRVAVTALVGSGVAATVALGLGAGGTDHRAPAPVAAAPFVSGTAAGTLTQAAAYVRAAPTAALVRVSEDTVSTTPFNGHGQPEPTTDRLSTVTWRPSDLGDTTTPWVLQKRENGQTLAVFEGRCGTAGIENPIDVCGSGSWQNVNPQFVKRVASWPAQEIARQLQQQQLQAGEDARHGVRGVSAPEVTAVLDAVGLLETAAGDNVASARIYEGVALVAATHPDHFSVVNSRGSATVTATDGATSASVTIDTATGQLTGWSHDGGAELPSETSVLSVTPARPGDVPSTTPAQPSPGTPSVRPSVEISH